MKPRLFFVALALLAAPPVCAQGGFVDNSGRSAASAALSVEEAKKLRDDSPVQLQGNIVRALGDEKYVLRDASGEIVVEIDDDVWRGVTVGPDDKVEIRGEIDRDFPGFSVEIEVDAVKKP
ncbi:MAG: NirD/YgiW/YdeI family stress tolerance protein [Candidatus Accumulibacter sp.]|nr:NirD/YgiW/YdeI family stress tolerance protein [Accumulibacter sp.]